MLQSSRSVAGFVQFESGQRSLRQLSLCDCAVNPFCGPRREKGHTFKKIEIDETQKRSPTTHRNCAGCQKNAGLQRKGYILFWEDYSGKTAQLRRGIKFKVQQKLHSVSNCVWRAFSSGVLYTRTTCVVTNEKIAPYAQTTRNYNQISDLFCSSTVKVFAIINTFNLRNWSANAVCKRSKHRASTSNLTYWHRRMDTPVVLIGQLVPQRQILVSVCHVHHNEVAAGKFLSLRTCWKNPEFFYHSSSTICILSTNGLWETNSLYRQQNYG